jgi:hypothetical protein
MVERLRIGVISLGVMFCVVTLLAPPSSWAGRCIKQSYSGAGLDSDSVPDVVACRALCDRHDFPAPAFCEFDPQNGTGKQTVQVYRNEAKCSKGLEVRLLFSSYSPLEEQLEQRVFGNVHSRSLLSWAELNGCAPRESLNRHYHWSLSYSISPHSDSGGQQARLVFRSVSAAAAKDPAVLRADQVVSALTAEERKACENTASSQCPSEWKDALAFSTNRGGSFRTMSEALRDSSDQIFTREQLRVLHTLALRKPGKRYTLQSSWSADSLQGVSSTGSFLIDRKQGESAP